MTAPTHAQIVWARYYRLINSAYPPIDVFEDIADPQDWALLAHAESKTNPRLAETIGNLDLVPQARRVGGPGASYVMAPFTHCTPDKPGRFHDGHRGAFYGADRFETAIAETVHHVAGFFSATSEAAGWVTQMRELIGSVDAELIDIRGDGFADLLDPDSYAASQAFAAEMIATGADGIVYPSVRQPYGQCFAAFYPDIPDVPVQGRHFSYHFDGQRIDMIKELTLDGQGSVYELGD
ncbi:RES family NAD+ phosphorylase [Pararhizobium sp. IMCC21322]|uniref:RES family NAD+ phosphorylase n=1 Tax=Pararhizobium sp. IMCC21322 TaxID=3067903 RepID=UPI0027412C23|nr:RES family NAD+ phosphorylase [Pararhizobium sp. IMCC21322]